MTLLPLQAVVELGPLRLYAYRIALLLLFPWIVGQLMTGKIKLVLPDVLIMFASIWMFISFTMHMGFAGGLESGGVIGAELMSAYFIGRRCVRNQDALRRILILALPGFLFAAALVAIESITQTIFVAPFFERIFGSVLGIDIRYETRLGLLRAFGPFPHPILGGLYLSSLIAIFALSGFRARTRNLGILAGCAAFFSLSSAGLIGIILNIALLSYEKIQKRVNGLSWPLLVYTTIVISIGIELVSEGGLLSVIIRYLTFDAATGYYRLLIWEYAGADVWQHPWIGIGFAEFTRPVWMVSDSIDAHWLLLAVRYGLPCALSVFLTTILAIFAIGRATNGSSREDRSFLVGIGISLFVMAMLLFTVTLWGPTLAWFTMLLGAAVGAARGTNNTPRVNR
jgi:MFS family permease